MGNCANCGSELKEGERFCTKCGAASVEAPVPLPPIQPPVEPPVRQPVMPPPIQPPGQQQVPPSPGGSYGAPPPAPFEAPKARKGLPRGAKIAIIAGIVIVLLIGGIVALSVVFFWNAITAPADVANEYVEALNEGDIDAAWECLSSKAQEDEGRSGFEEKVKELKGQIETWNVNSVQVENSNADLKMDLKGKGGEEATWEMQLVKKDGEWKILVYTMSD